MANWSQIECELIVQDYMSMYASEIRGEPYSKAEHRRKLLPQLDKRSEGSIEFKHQNISAILIELGYPYVQGYKPAHNYQNLLKETVVAHLSAQSTALEDLVSSLSQATPDTAIVEDWGGIIDSAPELTVQDNIDWVREFNPVKYNYQERESRNRKLGELGEGLVVAYERYRLQAAGREDLAQEVEWTSKERGDGTGYDIRSFNDTKDEELFIEVKTTNSGKYQPFMISDNEVAFSDLRAERYALYRVFNFRSAPKIFILPGNIKEHVNLAARQYRASF